MVYLTRKRASGLNAGDRRGGSRLRLPPPRQPLPTGGRFPIDTLPGSASPHPVPGDRFTEDPLSPRARYPDYRQRLPAPLRGREEAAERPGGGGDRLQPWKTVPGDTSRQWKGRSAPSPSAPPHGGAIPHRYTARECINHRVSVDPRQDPVSTPWHGIRTIAPHCPPP